MSIKIIDKNSLSNEETLNAIEMLSKYPTYKFSLDSFDTRTFGKFYERNVTLLFSKRLLELNLHNALRYEITVTTAIVINSKKIAVDGIVKIDNSCHRSQVMLQQGNVTKRFFFDETIHNFVDADFRQHQAVFTPKEIKNFNLYIKRYKDRDKTKFHIDLRNLEEKYTKDISIEFKEFSQRNMFRHDVVADHLKYVRVVSIYTNYEEEGFHIGSSIHVYNVSNEVDEQVLLEERTEDGIVNSSYRHMGQRFSTQNKGQIFHKKWKVKYQGHEAIVDTRTDDGDYSFF